jgi:site-specific recombinase XerD
MGSPVVTVFVRHSADCKYKGDEFCRRCRCRKHLRWTQNGVQHRRKAGTRSWEEAEEVKRQLQDQLAGRTPEQRPEDNTRTVEDAVDLFIQDKKVQGVTAGVIKKYTLELERLREYCERQGVYTIQGVTRELLTGFCGTWEAYYPSSYTRSKVRERCRSFLRYCFEANWLERIPALPKIKVEEPPTMPLTEAEYRRLLDALHVANPRRWDGKNSTQGMTPSMRARVRALFQLMRWSGLAIRDAVTLERSEIQHDEAKGLYRIVTSRQKTGTHVSVPIPSAVAQELLTVANGNERYIFWTGEGSGETIAKTWANRYVRPVFEAAGLDNGGHMLSHRLRDTFAVDLLEKGVPMEEVSKLLGHESIRTTERHYAKWVKGRQDRLDSLVVATWATQSVRRRAQKQ